VGGCAENEKGEEDGRDGDVGVWGGDAACLGVGLGVGGFEGGLWLLLVSFECSSFCFCVWEGRGKCVLFGPPALGMRTWSRRLCCVDYGVALRLRHSRLTDVTLIVMRCMRMRRYKSD
jgi:hypothetical protein